MPISFICFTFFLIFSHSVFSTPTKIKENRHIMAVEAQHLNLSPPQVFSSSRELVTNNNGVQGKGNVFGTPMEYRLVAPLSGTTTAPIFTINNNITQSKIGLTYTVPPVSRKRSRETAQNQCGSFRFLGEYISHEMQQHQLQIDRFISQHMEKLRMEVEQRRKRYLTALEENIMKNLKSKDEEIEKMEKLNWELQERVKSLSVENQIWRDLAQTNEAMVNALRCNLEQVNDDVVAAFVDDAQSYCGSNLDEINRTCRSCWREESCVLLLPCRHLCLCTVCGSGLLTCPVCRSIKTASVHVNLF